MTTEVWPRARRECAVRHQGEAEAGASLSWDPRLSRRSAPPSRRVNPASPYLQLHRRNDFTNHSRLRLRALRRVPALSEGPPAGTTGPALSHARHRCGRPPRSAGRAHSQLFTSYVYPAAPRAGVGRTEDGSNIVRVSTPRLRDASHALQTADRLG